MRDLAGKYGVYQEDHDWEGDEQSQGAVIHHQEDKPRRHEGTKLPRRKYLRAFLRAFVPSWLIAFSWDTKLRGSCFFQDSKAHSFIVSPC
jgi:hypothetical protein